MSAFLEACKEDPTLLGDLVPALHCCVLTGLLFVDLEHPRSSSFLHPSVCQRGVVQSSLGPRQDLVYTRKQDHLSSMYWSLQVAKYGIKKSRQATKL